MPAKRELTMRQLRQMLRLHHDGLGAREIGRRLGVARSTIQDNLKRAQVAELVWPLPPDLSEEELERRLFSHGGTKRSCRRRIEPDCAVLARELKRPGVNLTVLWEEDRAGHPDGYGYSSYVAAKFMFGCPGEGQGYRFFPRLNPQHTKGPTLNYKAFRNAISDGSELC